jgi:hypothetical protein
MSIIIDKELQTKLFSKESTKNIMRQLETKTPEEIKKNINVRSDNVAGEK